MQAIGFILLLLGVVFLATPLWYPLAFRFSARHRRGRRMRMTDWLNATGVGTFCGVVAFGSGMYLREQPPSTQGRLGLPLESSVTIEGVVVEGPHKGYDGGLCVRVRRLDGVAIQELVQLPLRTPAGLDFERAELPLGSEYEFRGVESGSWIGLTEAEMDGPSPSQGALRSYVHHFLVASHRPIAPYQAAPSDFADRSALFEGVASVEGTRCQLIGATWTLALDPTPPGFEACAGKAVVAFGRIQTLDDGTFSMVPEWWSLVRLEDQVDQDVALRCRLIAAGTGLACLYRGTRIALELDELYHGIEPHTLHSQHWAPALVRGRLERRASDNGPDAEQFVIKGAALEAIGPLLEPETPLDPP